MSRSGVRRLGSPVRLLALLLFCFVGLAAAQALAPIPALAARVTDQTATLSADQKASLESKLAALEKEKGAQIAVLLVASVRPETVTEYGVRVFEKWKLGRKGIDDGALLLVAKDDRKLRIEVGYGLEGALNDAAAKRIISETITPYFKQGDYFGGIDAGVNTMISVINGEPLPEPDQHGGSYASTDDYSPLIFGGFILVFFVGQVLRGIFGRLAAAGMVSVTAGVIAAVVLSSLLSAIGAAILVFFLSLFAGMRTDGGSSGRHGGWGGGGGGFGGGGGGFSGGGGSSGGGGASGGW